MAASVKQEFPGFTRGECQAFGRSVTYVVGALAIKTLVSSSWALRYGSKLQAISGHLLIALGVYLFWAA
jgi:cytochrome c biogenesis protein CcdA